MCAQLISSQLSHFAVSLHPLLCFPAFDCSWWSLDQCCRAGFIMKWSFPCRPGIRIPGFHLKLQLRWASDVLPVDLRIYILKKKKQKLKSFAPHPQHTGTTCWIYGFPLDVWWGMLQGWILNGSFILSSKRFQCEVCQCHSHQLL